LASSLFGLVLRVCRVNRDTHYGGLVCVLPEYFNPKNQNGALLFSEENTPMSWLESHQSLRHHPKLSTACRILSAPAPHIVGHLHFLWWWCMDYALDGDLSCYTNEQIADAAGWTGDANLFVQALANSGFLDEDNSYYKIHDWYDFCGELVKRKLERKNNKPKKVSGKASDNVRQKLDNVPPTDIQTYRHTDRDMCAPNGGATPFPPIPEKRRTPAFTKPSLEEVAAYCGERGHRVDPQKFLDHYEANGWRVGRNPMRDWKAAVRTWERSSFDAAPPKKSEVFL
jgi:hypothetical protein